MTENLCSSELTKNPLGGLGDVLTALYRAIGAKLNRPLRVLDVACGRGFYSFGFAQLGAKVFGIDSDAARIEACAAFGAAHKDLDVRFQIGAAEDVLAALGSGVYDLVVGIGAFDRFAGEEGAAVVQKIIASFADKIGVGVFTGVTRQSLAAFAFVHEIPSFAAAGCAAFVVSNRFWVLDGVAGVFDEARAASHVFANNAVRKTRRYFFGEGKLVKVFAMGDAESHDINKREFLNEVGFLQNPPTGFVAPKLILQGQHDGEVWSVREQIPGELLLDKIRSGAAYDADIVLRDVLEQLAALEAAGLYHDDVRTSNVLIKPDGHACLIDYGAISGKADDSQWPYSSFLAFMIFAHEALFKDAAKPFPLRAQALNPDEFAEPYRSAFWRLVALPLGEWRFSFLRAALGEATAAPHSGFARLIASMGEACGVYQGNIQALARRAAQEEERARRG